MSSSGENHERRDTMNNKRKDNNINIIKDFTCPVCGDEVTCMMPMRTSAHRQAAKLALDANSNLRIRACFAMAVHGGCSRYTQHD